MKIIENDEAVSPVIGVILMVAITVILAAVIAAFVFGLAGTAGGAKNVAVTAQLTANNTAVITWQGGADLNKITEWTVKIAGTDDSTLAGVAGPPVVGDIDETGDAANGQRLIITATFQDGTSQIIFDKQF